MKIDFEDINKLLQGGNLSKVARATNIPKRTLEDWKYSKNKWLIVAEERLTKLQKAANKHNNK